MTDIAKIAAGLTKAQAQALLNFRLSSDGKKWLCPVYRDMGAMRNSLHALGLCNNIGVMSKSGLALRQHLKDADNG